MVRGSFLCLNGYWDFAVSSDDKPCGLNEKILVPLSPESMLSGIKTRMCLRTDSAEVSARIIGSPDAVGLLGDGDMLYLAARAIAPIRVQTPTVMDKTL